MADFQLSGEYVFSETIGIDSSNSRGTAVTGGASSNTKGSWAELSSSISEDCHLLVVCFVPPTADIIIREFRVDIGIGAASSEQVVISDIQIQAKASIGPVVYYPVRVAIPAGTRVAARLQTNSGSDVAYLSCMIFSGSLSSPTPFSEHIAVGLSGASGGTAIDPGGTANTKGSWVELSSSTSDDLNGFFICIGGNTNSSHTTCDFLLDIGIGGSGSEQVIAGDIHITASSLETAKTPIFIDSFIPSGTRVAARLQSSITDATDRVISISLNGAK